MEMYLQSEQYLETFYERNKAAREEGNEYFEEETRRRLDEMQATQIALKLLVLGIIQKVDQANIAREGESEVIQQT